MYFVIAQIADCIIPAMWNFFKKSLITPLDPKWHYYHKIQYSFIQYSVWRQVQNLPQNDSRT